MADSASRISAWHSFRLRRASGTEVRVGAYGGHPRGIRMHEWPRCSVCANPMCHMAQVDAGPWLNLHGWARTSVFICHATGGRCEDWDPWKGANRVLLHRNRDDNLYDGPPTVRVYRRTELAVDQAIDERSVIADAETAGATGKAALDVIRHDKLGGGAVWLHADDTPQSPTQKGSMRMVIQLTTSIVGFDITPGGMAYVFLDPYDSTDHAGRLLWQGG